jgi:transglutaminase-like putative cysteine protease
LAVESNPEQILRSAVDQARQSIEDALASSSRLNVAGTVAALQKPYEAISASHLLISERMRLRGDALQNVDGQGSVRHRDAAERYAMAAARVLTGFEKIFTAPLIETSTLRTLRSDLDVLAPSRKPDIHGSLPYTSPSLRKSSPAAVPRIIPAYRLAEVAPAMPVDFIGTPEAPTSAMISSQARMIAAGAGRIHWDPAAIYNWVRENVRTEWYWGSMKGAEETLRQKCGNDADQAALLIALLRASGYPARYVRGVAEFFPGLDAARSITGINDPEQILTFFQAAGIPCEIVHEGGSAVNLRFEHIWVEALVPYANYRGMEADTTGKIWVPLDTSLKTAGFDEPSAIDLPSLPDNPLSGYRNRYLQGVREQSPLEALRLETESFLSVARPGRSYADVLHTRVQKPAPLSILPSTLQFIDTAVTAEYAALPLELQHQVRLRAFADDHDAEPLFDLTVPLRELSNRQSMIGFEPETIEDQERINRWGGLDNIPAYLVRLRPTVVIAGERLAVAVNGLAAGSEFRLAIDFSAPAGMLAVSDQVVCGYPVLLGIAAQEALPKPLASLSGTAPDLLYRAALVYIDSWNRSERELADLLNLALVRPLPTFVAIGGQLRVDELAGMAHAVDWQGLYLDANLRVATVVLRAGADDDRAHRFFELSALEGSVQEHRLFEAEFNVASISAAKLIGLAQSTGLPMLMLDSVNLGELLPTLHVNAAVNADIADAVANGQVVQVPAANVSYSAWSGIGYLKENPLTGEAGYMLSGGLAGGQTVLGRRDWPAELAAIMSQPFTGPPNEDIARAFSLTAVTPPEVMLATAGEELSGTLMALVRDETGVPVMNAPVAFKLRTGGGWLLDEAGQGGQRLQEITVPSGRDGIARARFIPGQLTLANPVAYMREGDQYGNIVGENLVDVQLESGSLAQLTTPLAIFGFAGRPDLANSKASGDGSREEVFSYSGDVMLWLADRFGNPVANHPAAFMTLPVEPIAGSLCQSPSGLTTSQRNAQLVADDSCIRQMPVFGECKAAANLTVVSRTDGSARVGVILGGVPRARYPVEVTVSTATGVGSVTLSHYSEAFASCYETAPPENRIVLHYQTLLDAAKRNVDARPAGQPAEILIKSWLLAEDSQLVDNGEQLSCGSSPDKICDIFAGIGSFEMMPTEQVVINGRTASRASAMNNSPVQSWLYRGNVTLPPGLSTIGMEASAVRAMDLIENHCSECGEIKRDVEVAIGPVFSSMQIWGVAVEVPDVVQVQVDGRGVSQRDLPFSFKINPAGYVASFAQVLLYRNGELWDTIMAGTTGTASIVFPAGYFFDSQANYELQVLLNNAGETNEILSRRVPLLLRTASVDLQIEGLPSAVKGQVGAFVLLNNDFDEKDADPAVTLPDAATPAIVATDDELKRAWLLIDDSSGQSGYWRVQASDPARLRIYYQKAGAWVEFKPQDPPEPVAAYPATIPLYLEGLAESAMIRGDTLSALFTPTGGVETRDELRLTTLDLDMAVDGNRDRTIDFRSSPDETALFWVNNDHDVSGTEDGQPVEDDAATGDDSVDAQISCKRDLEDFSRLHVWLGAVAAPGVLTYTLEMVAEKEMVQPMLNVFPAVNLSDGYLGLPGPNATPDQPDKQIAKQLLAAVGRQPVVLQASSLPLKGENPFLFEGRMHGRGKLVLTANYQDVPVASRSVSLELVDPVWFYDHFVVSQSGKNDDSPVNAVINPEGMAAGASRTGLYQPANNEYVLFVHGWNMQPWEKKRWAETIFKRLWWQGYKGKVGLFDWPCNTFTLVPGPTNFDRSEYKAWQSATALKGVLNQLSEDHQGQIRLLAHSQGNVVASEALRLGESGLVHTYVASQAALSSGFYEQYDLSIGPVPSYVVAIEPQTPDVLAFYPPEGRLPYLAALSVKVGQQPISYFNSEDYALVTANFSWEVNNRYKPDESIGYRYFGNVDQYQFPSLPDNGFVKGHTTGSPPEDQYIIDDTLDFPMDRYEIFSFGGESRTKALGAVPPPASFSPLRLDIDGPGSRDLRTMFGFDKEGYSHSRQFRSSVVLEQGYWKTFMKDTGLSSTYP